MYREAARIPGASDAPPVSGLTSDEVRQRRARGEVNRTAPSTSRPIGDILKGNILTIFNAILALAVVLLLAVGQSRDAVLTGGLVLFSVGISTAQEIRAKLRLDRIALLARVPVRVVRDGREQSIDQAEVVLGEYLALSRGEPIIVDGVLVRAESLEVDESLLTGESEPVAKTAGDKVLSGSFCVAGTGVYVAERISEASYAQRLTSVARTYRHRRTPTQRLLDRVLRVLLVIVVTITVIQVVGFVFRGVPLVDAIRATAVMATLVPQGLLLMSTVAYSVGALRLAQCGALVQDLNAVESLSRADVLCIDKTGTLTSGQLSVREIVPLAQGPQPIEKLIGLFAASLPEPNATLQAIASSLPSEPCPVTSVIPFSSERKWSALTFTDSCPSLGSFVLGAPEVVLGQSRAATGASEASKQLVEAGRRVLLLAMAPEGLPQGEGVPHLPNNLVPLALIALEDEVRADAASTLQALDQQGVSVKIISGDHPQTVQAVASVAGLPSSTSAVSGPELFGLPPEEQQRVIEDAAIFGRISPDEKQFILRSLQSGGRNVAMIGDGVNDVLALTQADTAVAMRSGSPAARALAGIVLLTDSFSTLPKALTEGRRIITRMLLLIMLFLIRDVATIGLILGSSSIGAPFPLLPPHAALIAFRHSGYTRPCSSSPGQVQQHHAARVLGSWPWSSVEVGATSALAATSLYPAHPDRPRGGRRAGTHGSGHDCGD